MTSSNDPSTRPNRLGLRRLELLRPHVGHLSLGVCALIVAAGIQLCYPKAIAFYIDNSIVTREASWLAWAAAIVGVVMVVQAASTAAHHYLFASIGSRIVASLRKTLYGAIIRQEIGFFDKEDVGTLTNRLSSDVEQLQDVLTTELSIFLQALLMAVGGATMLVIISPGLSLLVFLIAPAIVLSTRWIGIQVRKHSSSRQEKLAYCAHVAQETFSNIRLVHAFTQEATENRKYARATNSALDLSLLCNRLFAGFHGIGTLLQSMALLMTLWFGAKLIAAQSLSVGDVASFVLYAGMAAGSASTLSELWGEWMRSVGATDRVFQLLDRVPKSPAKVGTSGSKKGTDTARRQQSHEPCFEFDTVTFSYPTRPQQLALDSVDLRVNAGERVALVGPSGAGKSTIVSLLLGFYTPTGGIIRFDGCDAGCLDITDIRRNIAIVEQEPALFSGTIIDNIRYGATGAEVGDEIVMDAARNANVQDFVSEFPHDYATLVGHRGVQLSGGQKQRIAIARALVRNPRILVLDEATSALDAENEWKVQTALERLMEGRTTILVAHRLSTVRYADRVVVMKDGHIVQNGTHEQLMERPDGLYHRLMKSQLAHGKCAPGSGKSWSTAGMGPEITV